MTVLPVFLLYLYLVLPMIAYSIRKSTKLVRSLILFPQIIIAGYYLPLLCGKIQKELVSLIASLVLWSFMKILEFVCDVYDQSVVETPFRFLIHFFVQTDVKFHTTTGMRWNGFMRLCGGIGNLIVSVFIILFAKKTDFWFWNIEFIWNPYFFLMVYFNIKGMLDGVVCGFIQMLYGEGLEIGPMWNNLLTVGSLREFWSGWNIGIRNIFYRTLYLPFNRSKLVGFCIFILSGIMHEYPTWFFYGQIRYNMITFFTINGIYIFIEATLIPDGHIKRLAMWIFVFLSSSIFAQDFVVPYSQLG